MATNLKLEKKHIYIIGAIIGVLILIGFIGLIVYLASPGDKDSSSTTSSPTSPSTDHSSATPDFTTKLTTTSKTDQTTSSSTSKSDFTTHKSSSTTPKSIITTTEDDKIDTTTTSVTDQSTGTTNTNPSTPEDHTTQKPVDPENDKYLLENSKKLNSWIHNEDLKFETNFYFFNITNAEGILKNKEKPNLQQVGPYKFSEKRIYDIKGWDETKEHISVNFRKNYFAENPDKLDDIVTVLNVPLVTLYNLVENSGLIGKGLIKMHLDTYPMFVSHRVGDLLFNGYEDRIIQTIKTTLKIFGRWIKVPSSISQNGRFSFMKSRNDTTYGTWSVNTGKSSLKRLGQLYTIDGSKSIGCWSNQCDLIKGSDGFVHSPFSVNLPTIDMFVPELNRSVELDNEEESSVKGFATRKFYWSNDTLKSKDDLDTNECYYNPNKHDVLDKYSGIVRNSHCNWNIPMVFSYPHFYQAARYFTLQVNGMQPSNDYRPFIQLKKDDSAELMYAKKNIQINIDTEHISKRHKISRYIFPLFWLDEVASYN